MELVAFLYVFLSGLRTFAVVGIPFEQLLWSSDTKPGLAVGELRYDGPFATGPVEFKDVIRENLDVHHRTVSESVHGKGHRSDVPVEAYEPEGSMPATDQKTDIPAASNSESGNDFGAVEGAENSDKHEESHFSSNAQGNFDDGLRSEHGKDNAFGEGHDNFTGNRSDGLSIKNGTGLNYAFRDIALDTDAHNFSFDELESHVGSRSEFSDLAMTTETVSHEDIDPTKKPILSRAPNSSSVVKATVVSLCSMFYSLLLCIIVNNF